MKKWKQQSTTIVIFRNGHLIAATVMTLGLCQGHSLIATFFYTEKRVAHPDVAEARHPSCNLTSLVSPLGVTLWIFSNIFGGKKTRVRAIMWHCLRDPKFSRCDTISACCRQTDTHTQTHDDSIYHTSITSRGKNARSFLKPNVEVKIV